MFNYKRGVWGWLPAWSAKPAFGLVKAVVGSIPTTPLQNEEKDFDHFQKNMIKFECEGL